MRFVLERKDLTLKLNSATLFIIESLRCVRDCAKRQTRHSAAPQGSDDNAEMRVHSQHTTVRLYCQGSPRYLTPSVDS